MNAHTPTPWSLERDGSVVMANQVVLTHPAPDGASREEAKANAEFIVRACNSHEALVEALRGLTDSVQRMVHRLDAEPGNQMVVSLWMTKIDAAHAALALAESK